MFLAAALTISILKHRKAAELLDDVFVEESFHIWKPVACFISIWPHIVHFSCLTWTLATPGVTL